MDSFAQNFPTPVFNFRVMIDGVEISCAEVSGLDIEAEEILHRVGDDESFRKRSQAGLVKMPTVSIKKALFPDDDRFTELINRIFDKDYYMDVDSRMDILVELLDEHGDTKMTWNITEAYPIKLGGTALKSDGNELFMESLDFKCGGVDFQIA